MTTGIANNWPNLNVVGRVDLDALTVNGVEVTGLPQLEPQSAASVVTVADLVALLISIGIVTA